MSGAAFGLAPEHRHQPIECPTCGYRFDAASRLTDDPGAQAEAPDDGSVSICLACGSLGIFADGVTRLRLPTADERAELMASVEIQAVVQAVTEARDRQRDWPRGPRSPQAPT